MIGDDSTAQTVAPWPVTFGIENEIGIAVVEEPDADVVEESIALVRSAVEHGLPDLWTYDGEDPHVDARGFRVKELRQDTDEANYFSVDVQRTLTFAEIKSDLVLRNGARFYNDHAHPEYSTPECATLRDLIAHDRAGEHILENCARSLNRAAEEKGQPRTIRLYKNNTDFRGHSYGCHDNYLIARSTPFARLVAGMTPFLVTRQIFAGAGKVGWEGEDRAAQSRHGDDAFQISQRADFFTELVSVDTMNKRPLINTRDEPHADSERYRRFHIILGDANMSAFATWLKIGTTALVLEALAESEPLARFALADPIRAHREISRDASFKWLVETKGGGVISAIDLQRETIEFVRAHADLDHPEKRAVVSAWEDTLDRLARAPLELYDRLDWPAKRFLLNQFREAEGLKWSDPWLQSLDLEYHLLDREQGLFFGFERSMAPSLNLVPEAEILDAVRQPPRSSRAYLRGKCIQRFASDVVAAQWEHIIFEVERQLLPGTARRGTGKRRIVLDLGRAFPGDQLEHLCTALDNSADLPDFLKRAGLV